MIVDDLVGRVLHVSTNGAELDHKCIDPLNDQRAYFNTTAIFEKDIVLLKDISHFKLYSVSIASDLAAVRQFH